MKFHQTTTKFNCGIDLHARSMYVCLMDPQGKKLVHTNIRNNDFDHFLKLVEPYRHDLTVCCECMFGWYWLSDACQQANLTFVLAHALYLRCIHGGKNKNDRIDSEKIAHLLRSNLIPPAYAYPAEKRPLRALLRQRLTYLRWAFGEGAVIAKRDHALIGPLFQRLEARMSGNKFKANTVIAVKLGRAAYFMLKNHTTFDADRLVAALTNK